MLCVWVVVLGVCQRHGEELMRVWVSSTRLALFSTCAPASVPYRFPPNRSHSLPCSILLPPAHTSIPKQHQLTRIIRFIYLSRYLRKGSARQAAIKVSDVHHTQHRRLPVLLQADLAPNLLGQIKGGENTLGGLRLDFPVACVCAWGLEGSGGRVWEGVC